MAILLHRSMVIKKLKMLNGQDVVAQMGQKMLEPGCTVSQPCPCELDRRLPLIELTSLIFEISDQLI